MSAFNSASWGFTVHNKGCYIVHIVHIVHVEVVYTCHALPVAEHRAGIKSLRTYYSSAGQKNSKFESSYGNAPTRFPECCV